MAKMAKVTYKAIRDAIGEYLPTTTVTLGAGENEVKILVKNRLTLSERRDMVTGIADMLFVDVDGEEQYCAFLKKFAFDFHILTFFTNISIPSDVDDVCKMIDTTDVVRRVMASQPDGYIGDVLAEANEMIEFRKAKLVRRNKLSNVVSGLVDTINVATERLNGMDGKDILQYLEQNFPLLKEKVNDIIQEQAAEKTAE